jgi:hypothetical protein
LESTAPAFEMRNHVSFSVAWDHSVCWQAAEQMKLEFRINGSILNFNSLYYFSYHIQNLIDGEKIILSILLCSFAARSLSLNEDHYYSEMTPYTLVECN